jgi:hypothetical protein
MGRVQSISLKKPKGSPQLQVFVPFADGDSVHLLGLTLDVWELAGCEPAVVELTGKPENRFRAFRVAADNLAENELYVLADIGCIPAEKTFDVASKVTFDDGLAGLAFKNRALQIPTGVRVCRKGAVSKWPQTRTATYDEEHAEAVKLAGKNVVMLPDVFYRHVVEV